MKRGVSDIRNPCLAVLVAALCALAISTPAYACVEASRHPLGAEDAEALDRLLDSRYSQVSSKTPIRSMDAYGHWVVIQFEPHGRNGAVDVFYYLECTKARGKQWQCGRLNEKFSMTFSAPADHVEIGATMDPVTIERVVKSVRKAIVVSASGHYEFTDGRSKKNSGHPLDILRIEKSKNGRYLVHVDPKTACTEHIVEVLESACRSSRCSYKVTENEIKHIF